MLLGLDRTVPFSLAQILVPGLAPHAPLAVAFGQVALYLALVVIGSFYVRRHIGQRTWRTLHYLTFLAFLGATAHGIGAGTDSGSPWAQALYLGAGRQSPSCSRTGSRCRWRGGSSAPPPPAHAEARDVERRGAGLGGEIDDRGVAVSPPQPELLARRSAATDEASRRMPTVEA